MKKKDLPSKIAVIAYAIITIILFIIFLNTNNNLTIFQDLISAIIFGIPTTIAFILGYIIIEHLINYGKK